MTGFIELITILFMIGASLYIYDTFQRRNVRVYPRDWRHH